MLFSISTDLLTPADIYSKHWNQVKSLTSATGNHLIPSQSTAGPLVPLTSAPQCLELMEMPQELSGGQLSNCSPTSLHSGQLRLQNTRVFISLMPTNLILSELSWSDCAVKWPSLLWLWPIRQDSATYFIPTSRSHCESVCFTAPWLTLSSYKMRSVQMK